MTPEQATMISVLIAIATFCIGRLSVSRNDGKEQGILLNKVDNLGSDIKSLSDKMDIRLTDIQAEQKEFRERLATVEASAKSAHKRLDDM